MTVSPALAPLPRLQTPSLIFFAVIGLLLLTPLAGALNLLYPALAVFTALYLSRLFPQAYISFTIWIWVLSPLARRLVDYRSSYHDPSPVLLTPSLVTAVALLPLLKVIGSLWSTNVLPYLLLLSAILYATAVGIIVAPIPDVSKSILLWGVPLIWAFYIVTLQIPAEEKRKVVAQTLTLALLVMALYGVSQYLKLPAWDHAWLESSIQNHDSTSFGSIEGDHARVWSTMNAPGIFAFFAMVCLVVNFAETSTLGIIALCVGSLAFLLSLTRVSWISSVIAFLLLCLWQSKRRAKLLAGFGFAVFLLASMISLPQFREVITGRMQSLSEGQQDGSLQERKATQEKLLSAIADTPLGFGIAPQLSYKEVGDAPIDSGLFLALIALGWPGSLVAGIAIFFLFRSFTKKSADTSNLGWGFQAAGVAALIHIPFGDIFTGPAGFLFYTVAALCVREKALSSTRPRRFGFKISERAIAYSNERR